VAGEGFLIDDYTLTKLLNCFEIFYAERAVYRAIAERFPDCNEDFDNLMADTVFRAGVSETFSVLLNIA
jgi:hypothetical protein